MRRLLDDLWNDAVDFVLGAVICVLAMFTDTEY